MGDSEIRKIFPIPEQQTTNDKRQTTNNKRQTTNNKQQTTNDKQPTTNDKQPITNNQQPTTILNFQFSIHANSKKLPLEPRI
ncbi:MAG: hypothetical protein F6K47_16080 [Symploca sp. SIO2E6]|nr:hypothetical protein [Symploca sp. SIO2E6]